MVSSRVLYGRPASSRAQRARRSRTWPRATSGTHLNAEIVITSHLLDSARVAVPDAVSVPNVSKPRTFGESDARQLGDAPSGESTRFLEGQARITRMRRV